MNQDEKDFQDWLAVLSGETVIDANPQTVLEASALRAELEYRRNPPVVNPQILENVLARLKQEETAEKSQILKPKRSKRTWWQQWEVGLSMAASMLIAVIIYHSQYMPPLPDDVRVRGKPKPIVHSLSVPNPQSKALTLQAEFDKLSIKATVTSKNGIWIVEVMDISTDNQSELATLFKQYGLSLPPSNKPLHIRIKSIAP